MSNYADKMQTENNLLQWTNISNFTEIFVLIYPLEKDTQVGGYFPIIFLSSASLNILLIDDFLINNIESEILNSVFVISGFNSLVSLLQKNNTQLFYLFYNKNSTSFSLEDYEMR